VFKFLPKQNILLLASLLLFKQLSKFFQKNTKLMLTVLIILIAYISFRAMYLQEKLILEIVSTLGRTLSVMILFPIFKKLVDLYAERATHKTIPFAFWMFLGVLITWFL
jgi:uncharacterized membrane protein (DUF485 family)